MRRLAHNKGVSRATVKGMQSRATEADYGLLLGLVTHKLCDLTRDCSLSVDCVAVTQRLKCYQCKPLYCQRFPSPTFFLKQLVQRPHAS